MYAIIKTGGKQYKVKENDIIEIERLDVEAGAKVNFDVLMLGDEKGSVFGNPVVAGASVTAEVLEHGKGKKVQMAIYKKMNGHHRAQGHRQPYSKVKITAIKK
ncbi:MAG: 50S ribosomal protein L21 [Clostridia bacterium]|nr:50S ribosomal protein L21 [Clostridia bacterium]